MLRRQGKVGVDTRMNTTVSHGQGSAKEFSMEALPLKVVPPSRVPARANPSPGCKAGLYA